MDYGSFNESGGSTGSSPTKSSAESLNSSKFRQEIFFKDVGIGGPVKSGADSFSSAASPPKKIRIGGVQSCQPPLCQVEGCQVDLRDAKAYYSRHKVCGMHSKSPTVIVAGVEQRFCQQCSRFHQLPEFDQGKRSCRRRLAGHNERRRKPPSGSLLSMGYGRRSSSSSENSDGAGSFPMDSTALRKPTEFDGWSTSRSPEHHARNHAVVGKHHPHSWQSTFHFSDTEILPGKRIAPVSDSTRALSLLSNEPWASTLAFSALDEGPLAQPTAHGGPHMSPLQPTFGYYKGNACPTGLPEPAPVLGLNHSHSGSSNGTFSGNVEMSQENERHFMEVGRTREIDPSIMHSHGSL